MGGSTLLVGYYDTGNENNGFEFESYDKNENRLSNQQCYKVTI